MCSVCDVWLRDTPVTFVVSWCVFLLFVVADFMAIVKTHNNHNSHADGSECEVLLILRFCTYEFSIFSFFFSIALGFGFVLFLCMCVVSGCAMLITTRKHFMDLLHWIRETKNNKESNSSIWNWQKLFWSDRKSLWRRYGSSFCCFSMNPTRASCTICTSYCRIEIVFIAYIIFNWCGLDKLLLHSHCHLRCYIFMAQWWCLQCFRHRTKSSEGRSHLLFCNDVIFTATLVLFQFPRLTRSSLFCLPAFTSCTNTHTHTRAETVGCDSLRNIHKTENQRQWIVFDGKE